MQDPPFADFADSSNPYQAPQASLYPGSPSSIPSAPLHGVQWIGDALLVPAQAQLPHRCVRCNEPTDDASYKTRTITYINPWLYLTFFAGLLIFLIVYLIARKQCNVAFGYCHEHRRQRTRMLLIGIGGLFLGLALSILAGSQRQPIGFVVGLGVVMAVCSLFSLLFLHNLTAKNHLNGWFHLRGFGRPFIEGNPSSEYAPQLPLPWSK